MQGLTKPKGSYTELTIDRIPRLVMGLTLIAILKLKASPSTFQ